jgi:hypothetical protein
MFSLSRPGFFRRGFTRACFSPGGTYPEDSDRLIIVAMDGASGAMHFLKRRVGSGSSSHELAGETLTSRITSSGTRWVKSCSTVPSDAVRGVGSVQPYSKTNRKMNDEKTGIVTMAWREDRTQAAVPKQNQE